MSANVNPTVAHAIYPTAPRNAAGGGHVVVVCPGGLEHGGGIGRQMGYFLRAIKSSERYRPSIERGVSYEIVDSRGPWFLGASRLHTGLALGYLAAAAVKLAMVRFSRSPVMAHINITGRGSTLRKVVLAGFSRCIGLPYVLHVHDADYGSEYLTRGTVMRWAIRTTFAKAKNVLVLGRKDQGSLSRSLQLPESQVTVFPNAVPDPDPDLARRRRHDAPCHLLFLGHLSERKGVPELLQALATPILQEKHWRATLAGGGPIEHYRRLATNLGIAQRVEFPGWLDQGHVRALCEEADVLVLPSRGEGLAMAVLEGLSYGLAVVTTPVGAHSEVIEPEISGLLVPPGDVDELAKALVRVAEDEILRNQLRAGARRRFLENYDVARYAERLQSVHASLL